MVTPERVEMSLATSRSSSRASKHPTQGPRAQEKRKRETSEEENFPVSKLVTKKPAVRQASEVTAIY